MKGISFEVQDGVLLGSKLLCVSLALNVAREEVGRVARWALVTASSGERLGRRDGRPTRCHFDLLQLRESSQPTRKHADDREISWWQCWRLLWSSVAKALERVAMRYDGLAVAASSNKLCLRAGSGKKKRWKGEVGWVKENVP
jgi:hypothetical protein